jgi:hypothetical protein
MTFYIPFAKIKSTGNFACYPSAQSLLDGGPFEALEKHAGPGRILSCHVLEIPAVWYGFGPFQIQNYIVTLEGHKGMVKVPKENLEESNWAVVKGEEALVSFKKWASNGETYWGRFTYFPKPHFEGFYAP